jgi:hypothetical protein
MIDIKLNHQKAKAAISGLKFVLSLRFFETGYSARLKIIFKLLIYEEHTLSNSMKEPALIILENPH